MVIKKYDYLPIEAKKLREDIFVKEQGFEEEFDAIDKFATHLVFFEEGKAIATSRYFYNKGRKCYIIGRIAVIKEKRNQGIGSKVVQETELCLKKDGINCVYLAAQDRAKKFYLSLGYEEIGETFYEEYCLHTWMKKNIS